MSRFAALGVLVLLASSLSCTSNYSPHSHLHTFYYGWYANEEFDGRLSHWNHRIMGDEEAEPFPGGDDIGANFFPTLGNYSSNDPAVIESHMKMIRQAGVGVLVASWWGPDSFEDQGLPALLDGAARYGLRVAFHLEPFPGRNAETSREALRYLIENYGDHPACHRPATTGGRPVIYVYDSYLTPAEDWARLLTPGGEITVRGTDLDAVMIGLWVGQNEGDFFLDGGFDGYYTYFGSDGFTWGSTSNNWSNLADFARRHDLLFVPCVGPGYIDTRIRPWNAATTRPRENGDYYDRMFETAIECHPPWIGITSFNEWHEGTQIEPAIPKSIPGYEYEDYFPREQEYYLERTQYWARRFPRPLPES